MKLLRSFNEHTYRTLNYELILSKIKYSYENCMSLNEELKTKNMLLLRK